MRSSSLAAFILGTALGCLLFGSGRVRGAAPAGPDPNFFPIAVWLQSTHNAESYKAAGINTYVGLWRGPTDAQLDQLKSAGMRLVCRQNEVALRRKSDPTILAWMHEDEPDNAQSRPGGGYGPPISPGEIRTGYQRIKERDPDHPVFLNLGQGVAWDNWVGRGVRTRHPEDYPEYVKGCDIASFDIYPAVHDHSEIAGKLWHVPAGVSRLRGWAGPSRTVWNCVEASRISNEKTKPTAAQIKAEVWMSIIHGSRGIVYFVHQFKPTFVEASLLGDAELLRGVTAINAQVRDLAAVINGPELLTAAIVDSGDPEAPVAITSRRHQDYVYIFAAAMREKSSIATFSLSNPSNGSVEVLGEARTIPVRDGKFRDPFSGYGVHLYRYPGRL